MKSLFKTLMLASAAILAAVGCQKESTSPEGAQKVHFVLHANAPETKTGIMYYNGAYEPYWNKGDELGVIFELPTAKGDLTPAATFKNTAESGNKATFEGDVTLEDGEGVTFYSFYPASSAAKYYVNNNVVTIGLDVPSSQTPTYDATLGYSFDPKADILIAKPATCTAVSGEAVNDVDMYFARLSALLRIELKAEGTAKFYGEVVKSLGIKTSKGDIAGRIVVNPKTGEYSKTNSLSTSTAITATYDTSNGPVSIGKTGLNNVFLSVAPVTIAKGSTVTVNIETVTTAGAEGHTITKTFTTTSDMVFESSQPTVLELSLTDDNILETNTISKITEAGTYSVSGVTVMAVNGQDIIVSDNTGSIRVYASSSSHGCKVGDVLDINGSVVVYNQIFEFSKPTITKTGTATVTYPTAVEYNAAKIADYATNSVIEYGHALGQASSTARTVTLTGGQVLNVYGDLASVDGRVVNIYGYAFGYYNSKVNFMYTAVPTVDESYSYLATNPKSGETITWASDESGSAKAQTITVTVNGKATGYTVSEASADWTVTDNGNGTLTVYPNAANTSTTADKTLDITVTHKDNTALTSTIHLVQSYSGAAAKETIDFESEASTYTFWTFSSMTSAQSNITSHGGSKHGTTGGKATASITTKNVVAAPKSISFYISKTSTNTKTSNWKIQVSSDNTTWTDVKSTDATSMTRGTWVEVTQDLSSYTNVYVRVYYEGSTAVRAIDDLELTF